MLIFLLLLFFPLSLFSQDLPDEEFIFSEEEGISVTGTMQTSQQMAIIDREEIERHGAADLATLLQETLNLNIVRYGAYGNRAGISLRGFDSKRVAFLVDGVPVNSTLDGKFDIEQIDLNSIERIEVIYGGSDSKYNVSGALGGVINIVTVKKQKQGLRLGGSVTNTSAMPGEYRGRGGETQAPHWEDLLDTQNYSLSAAYGGIAAGGSALSLTANVFANRADNHFLFTDYAEKTRRKDNNEVWDTGAGASLVWELPDLTKLLATSNFYYGDKNFPTSGFSGNFGNQQDVSARQNIMLDAPAFRDDLAAEVSLSWNFNRRDYAAPASAPSVDTISRHDQHSLNVINRWSWYLTPSPRTEGSQGEGSPPYAVEQLTLRSGVDYCFINLDSTEIGNRDRHDGGVYLTAEYKPVKSFMIAPSIKAAFSSTLGSDGAATVTAIPKLGLLWNVTDSLALKNNYFRSFKFPDFEELYWSGGGFGNPDLHPEDGWGADLGAEWRVTKFMKLESVFYTQWTKDSIHWYSKNGIWQPENVGEAIFFGLENRLKLEFPVDWGHIRKIAPSLSYQYLLSYLLCYGYTFASDKRIPYNPEHTVGGSLDICWDTGSILISGHYESLRYHDTANLTALKSYFLLNAAVNQKIKENFTAFGIVRNILNTSYESFYDYPMPGITITLGLRANFDIKRGD
jgi:vitamin B12 transporter